MEESRRELAVGHRISEPEFLRRYCAEQSREHLAFLGQSCQRNAQYEAKRFMWREQLGVVDPKERARIYREGWGRFRSGTDAFPEDMFAGPAVRMLDKF